MFNIFLFEVDLIFETFWQIFKLSTIKNHFLRSSDSVIKEGLKIRERNRLFAPLTCRYIRLALPLLHSILLLLQNLRHILIWWRCLTAKFGSGGLEPRTWNFSGRCYNWSYSTFAGSYTVSVSPSWRKTGTIVVNYLKLIYVLPTLERFFFLIGFLED